jgi:hypothetical protein
MPEDSKTPTPPEPTAAQLRSEIEALKVQIAGMVPSKERDQLKLDLDLARAELADLREKQKALEAPPERKGFFPRLF